MCLQRGVKLVVITAGENGARAYMPAERSAERSAELSSATAPTTDIQCIEQRTKHVQVVDSTGCGDAFAAGFLYFWKVSKNYILTQIVMLIGTHAYR